MTADIQQYDPHLMQLVLSLQAAAMQQMGSYAVAQYVGCELHSYISLFGVPL